MEKDCSSDNKDETTAIISNVQNICRICLGKDDGMISLLTTKENTLLLNMFSSVTSIKVHSEDGLPLQVCGLCENEIIHSYQFRIKCKKSNAVLKALIKKGSIDKCDTNICSNVAISSSADSRVNLNEMKNTNDEVMGSVESRTEDNEERTDTHTATTYRTENVDELEVEYLEEEIFDVAEIESLKQSIEQSSTKHNETSKTFLQLPVTDPKKECDKIHLQKNLKKGHRKYYTCSFCSKKFLKTRTLKVHIKRMHGKARHPYSCGQCKESFNSEHDLHVHSALHTKGTAWICNQCNKEFQERGKLRRHLRRHMQSKRHACDACGKQFAERCALRRHARVHTGQPRDKKYACHICDNRYSESAALAAHVSRHAGLRPCACDTCGKSFPSPRLLASHRRVHSDRKPHACHYCDKRFRHESTRNTHHRTHTGEKPYVCSACGKRFIQNSNLTLHMRTHTGEKPYSCDICERKFSSGSALASHRRTHTGEKPYGCPVCGKRFARVYLSSHMRQHTGERPFGCCVCAKRFASAARLRQHHLIHTGEKPFECAICSETFKTKGYLAKHLKNHDLIKSLEKRKMLILQPVDQYPAYLVGESGEIVNVNKGSAAPVADCKNEAAKNDITVQVSNNMEGREEYILPDTADTVKTELVVIDQGEGRGNICLRANGVKFGNDDLDYGKDLNLVTVNEGEVNISSSAVLEGTTVKLYQLDQSLVQIHTSGGQVTISKITSKMTANF